MNMLASLEKQSKLSVIITGFALVGGIGVLDSLTGYELSLSLFYLIPISLVTWRIGRRLGIVISVASSILGLFADVTQGKSYSQPAFYAWNTLLTFGFFAIVVLLLSELRRALEHETELARTDSLTGAVNSRSFSQLLQMEINRFKRYEHPFTVAYFDLDNFKTVNDQFGHAIGDQVLRAVADEARKHLRKTDVIARVGGDEFALLLPETDYESAQVVLSKIQRDMLEKMQQSHWPVTFSIGVLTCVDSPRGTDEAIRLADSLMYSIKHGGKNGIKYSNYAG